MGMLGGLAGIACELALTRFVGSGVVSERGVRVVEVISGAELLDEPRGAGPCPVAVDAIGALAELGQVSRT